MENTSSVTKFDIDNKTLYIKVTWQPNVNDLFHLKIFDGDKTWSGRFSYEFAKKYMERFDETEDQYYSNVKKGLAKERDFSYSFTMQSDDNNTAAFSWKKKFEDSVHGFATLVHGTVPVHRDGVTESKDFLIDFLLAENQDLREIIDGISSRNTNLSLDLEKCRNDLDKFMDMKTSLETSLYGKFVQLLTAKKRRIQLLEDNILKISKTNHYGDELD